MSSTEEKTGFTEKEDARVWVLDGALRTDNISHLFYTGDDDGFHGWYARLLSTLVVVSAERDIVFASTVVDGSAAHFVTVTDRAVMVADVQDMSGDEEVPVRVAPITAIQSLSVSADMRYDVKGSVKTAWPGRLTLRAHFDGLGEVRFDGSVYDRHRQDRIGDISRLLDILRRQLEV